MFRGLFLGLSRGPQAKGGDALPESLADRPDPDQLRRRAKGRIGSSWQGCEQPSPMVTSGRLATGFIGRALEMICDGPELMRTDGIAARYQWGSQG